jgi:hypothetical protein
MKTKKCYYKRNMSASASRNCVINFFFEIPMSPVPGKQETRLFIQIHICEYPIVMMLPRTNQPQYIGFVSRYTTTPAIRCYSYYNSSSLITTCLQQQQQQLQRGLFLHSQIPATHHHYCRHHHNLRHHHHCFYSQ